MPLFPALTGVAGTLPLPNTAPTPINGEDVDALQIQQLAQALLNQDRTLETRKLTYDPATGDVLTPINVDELTIITSLTIDEFAIVRQFAPQNLADSNHTLDSSYSTRRFRMLNPPAANRIVTLRQATAPVPASGDWFELTVFLGTSAFTVGVQREGAGGGDYVAVLGDGVGVSPWGSSNLVASARFEFWSGNWRLAFVGGGPVFSGSHS